jgi:NADPH2:quinone reductase
MRAMTVPRFGGPEVFEVGDVPIPVPGPGQVSIDVVHAGVNFTDLRNRRGDGLGVPPMILGIEVSGTIREVGEGVSGWAPGAPVTSLTGGHAYAEVVVAAADRVLSLPDLLVGDPAAACLMGVVPTAINLVGPAGKVVEGESILFHGASGGVGTALVQVAAVMGLGPVHGTVSSDAKADYARGYGFAGVHLRGGFVDSVMEATSGRGVDVVFDPIGGEVRAQSFDALAPFGRLIHFGNASLEQEVVPEATWLRARCVGYVGYSGGQHAGLDFATVSRSWREGVELVASGAVKIDVTRVLPLEEASEAHRAIEAGEVVGKVVLAVN